MGLGREVADAYIEVHGDLKDFRRSLSKAAASGRKEGMELADSFSQGFEKRAKDQFGKKWDSVLDATFSNKKVDWDRMVGHFDATGFDDAAAKVDKFLSDAQKGGKITELQYKRMAKAVRSTTSLMEAQHKQTLKEAEIQRKLREKQLSDEQARRWEMAKSRAEQERYNDSFAGMFRNNKLKDLESDFRNVTRAMSDMDWSKFTKGEENLTKVTSRIREVIKHMEETGRVSKDQGDKIAAAVRRHVIEEERRRAALRLTAEETRKAKDAQDRYNKSLAGMMDAAKLKALENGYKKIAAALANQDWGPVSKDFSNMRTFTKYVTETSEELRKTGKISESEFRRINDGVASAKRNTREWNVEFGKTRRGMNLINKATASMQKSWARMDGTVKLVLTGILAAAGPMATVLSGAAAGATSLVSSLGMALASAIPLAASAVALGVGIGLAVKSMDSMKATFPLIQQSIDRMSASWEAQAERFGAVWGASLGNLLDSFATQLESYDFGTPLGQAFSVITDAFNDVVNGPAFAAFMGAMTTDLPASVAGLGSGFAGLFSGLLSLMAGAAPAAKALGEDFAGWGAKIAASLEKARETGQLNEVFQKARESLLAVLDLAGSVGSALGTMFMLGADSGNRMLTSLAGIVDRFNAWMQTEEGRAKMLEWFENGERIMRALQPLAVGLGKALGGLVTETSIAQVEGLMTALGNLLPTLGGLLSAVSNLGILNTLAGLFGLVMTFVEPLLPALSELTTTMGAGVAGSLAAVSPLFAALGEALAPVVQMFADNLATILPNIPPLLEAVVGGLVPLIGAFGSILGFLGPLISGFVSFVESAIPWEALAQLLSGAFGLVTGAVQVLMGLFTLDVPLAMEGARLIFDSFIQVVNAVWMAIQHAFTFIQETLSGFIAFLGEVFAPVGEFFSGVWDGIVQTATEFGTTIDTFFRDTWTNIAAAIAVAWQGMVDAVGGYLQGIRDDINTRLDEFWQKFDAIFPGIRQLASDEMEELKEKLSKIFQILKESVSKTIEALQLGLKIRWMEIKNTASEIWESLKLYAQIKWLQLKEAVMAPINALKLSMQIQWLQMKQGISDIWEAISAYFTFQWLQIKHTFQTQMDGITNMVNAFGQLVHKYVIEPIQRMAHDVQAGWNAIVLYFQLAMNRAGEAVIRGIDAILRFFITLPNNILSYLANLPTLLQNVGTNMMQGLINGVRNMAGNILNAAMDAVRGAVDGVRKFLGINSPSRLFMGIGGFMGEGMAIGLDQSAKQVASAAHAMAEATTAEFSSSKMYTAGKDAASGLAKGLKDNKSTVTAAFSSLQSGVKAIGTDFSTSAVGSARDAAASGGKTVIIEDGAVRIETKTTDPKMSADMLLDGLVNQRAL